MLCNWSTSASTILRCVARCSSALPPLRHGPPAFSCGLSNRSHAVFSVYTINRAAFMSTSKRANGATSLAERPTDILLAPATLATSPDNLSGQVLPSSLTAAQISRAAAQTARLSARDGEFADALYVVISLFHSTKSDYFAPTIPMFKTKAPPPPPINFGQPVSPRLSAHAFLHGLLRAGYNKKAAIYAHVLQDAGLRIRPATIQSIIQSLSQRPYKPFKLHLQDAGIRWRPRRFVDGEQVLKIRCTMVSDASTRAALKLLLRARVFGQRRTQRMYESLIQGLLFQGEIMAGSMLVVLLIKCLQHMTGVDSAAQPETGSDAGCVPLGVDGSPFIFIPRDHTFKLPHATLETMNSVLREVNKAMESESGTEDEDRLLPALQALANLAMLLDTGQLPTGKLSVLIHTLYSCPKTDHYIWILDRFHKPVHVRAYTYFHSVLIRLIESYIKPNGLDPPLPRLDLRSYNALLFYALRHRLSPVLMARILDHMCCDRDPPLQPNLVTYNTLLRAGTLTRRKDIAEAALNALRVRIPQLVSDSSERPKSSTGGHRMETSMDSAGESSSSPLRYRPQSQEPLTENPPPRQQPPEVLNTDSSAPVSPIERRRMYFVTLNGSASIVRRRISRLMRASHTASGQYTQHSPLSQQVTKAAHSLVTHNGRPRTSGPERTLTELEEGAVTFPAAFFSRNDAVSVDAYTVASYISHLTAIGKPEVIADILFHMMPELTIVDHPTWGKHSDCRQRRRMPGLRKVHLRRAVHFGPYLFSSILNALAKARQTGAAERVWLLAKEAERASWLPNFAPDVEPWCLPVHAYTSMMRCYAEEAARAISRWRREQQSKSLPLPLTSDAQTWVPMFRGARPGWAAFVATMQKLHQPKYSRRRQSLRSVGSLLHRCMIAGGLSVYRSLTSMAKMHKPRKNWKGSFPLPDTRFFNEALRLFGRHPDMPARVRCTGSRFWLSQLRMERRSHERRGAKAPYWAPALQEIAEGIIRAGLPVPLGFRHLFVGRWEAATVDTGEEKRRRGHRPYAFPSPGPRFSPHAFVTVKTRGLPLPPNGRRTRLRRRRRNADHE